MLGELVIEEKGAVEAHRVLREGAGSAVEVTFRCTGKILGLDSKGLATYHSSMRADGSMYGEGQGVVMTTNGEGANWVGQGVGHFRPDGGMSWRGAIYYTSNSPTLKRLNGVALIFEHEVSPDDKIVNKIWEWK